MRPFAILRILSFLLISNYVSAQYFESGAGARSIALSSASVALADNYSLFNNSAATAFLIQNSVSSFYENGFLIKELSSKAIGGNYLLNNTSAINAGGIFFGDQRYNEQRFFFAVSKKLHSSLSAAIQINYLKIGLPDYYGSKGLIIPGISLYAILSERINLGFSAFNPFRSSLARFENEKVNSNLKLGLQYQFSDKLFIIGEVEKYTSSNTNLKLGLEYALLQTIFVRVGTSSNPFAHSFGFGFKKDFLNLDLAAAYNPWLGYSLSASFSFSLSK